MTDATVRPAVLSDAPAIASCVCEAYLHYVAVRPSARGTGVGRALLRFAEAEAQRCGHKSIYLATHELMVENRALYKRIGYVEYDHRVISGYPRVFFRKVLQ